MSDHDHTRRDHHKQRSAEEIEKDIHRSRERLDSTLHEIGERFSPQQFLNTSYDYIRHGGANEFVSNLGTTIKQNPLPFLVTTAGLGWLMMAQREPHQEHSHQHASSHRYMDEHAATGHSGSYGSPGVPVHEGTGDAPTYNNTPGYVVGGAEHHGDSQSRMSSMQESAKDKSQYVGQKAKQTAHNLGDKARHLGEKAQHMGGSMRDTTSHFQHGTRDQLHNMSDRARHAGSQSSDFIQEHPVVVGALGVALGAALASLFPTTRKEDEYLGEYHDRALHKAAETGQEQMDKAQHAIHQKTEHIKEDSHGYDHNQSHDQHASFGDNHQSASSATPGSSSTGGQPPGHNAASGISSSTIGTTMDTATGDKEPGLAGSNTPSGNTQGDDTLKPPRR